MMTWSNILFQDSNSPLMEQLIFFHDYIFLVIILTTIFLTYLLSTTSFNKLCNRSLIEEQTLELVWTTLPMFILLLIAFPSIHLLYLMDEITKPSMTMKIIGHQWYWSYEYPDFHNKEMNSYMKLISDSNPTDFRLLEVNNQIMVPYQIPIRLIVTSEDVLHSWTVPSLGIKIDAIPGRLNQMGLSMARPGLYYGQCSEICGINHSFMPICIESTTPKSFLTQIQIMDN
uniref:Cytochrome c oxidase subunit 2 n=1 Tax=Hemiodoecus leai TaxID=1254501 RepID=A0A0U1XEB4_9HEMI|nr:cytochrome c oxidase subunit II [Hemiodoecus leai]AIS38305.1 cytochrome c oxidase subunit II [Hemiodoecus leai]